MTRIRQSEGGFTLLEMLVAILVLATLSIIAMSTFLNQTEEAQVAAAQSDVSTAYRATSALWQSNSQKLPSDLAHDLAASEKGLAINSGADYVEDEVSVERLSDSSAIFRTSSSNDVDIAIKATFGSEYNVYRVMGDAASEVSNEVPNPSFESPGPGISDYLSSATFPAAQSSDWAKAGRYSASLSGTFPSSGFVEASLTSPDLPVTPGQTYTASAYLNVKTASDLSIVAPRIYIRWKDAGNSPLADGNTPGEWNALGVQRLVHTAKAPPSASEAEIIVVVANGGTSAIWNDTLVSFVDAVQFREESQASSYIDGNFPGASWNDADSPNDSSSKGPTWEDWR